MNPTEAVQIHQDLRARRSVGMHWGTFNLTDEPMDEPPQALARALRTAGVDAADFVVMQHGATQSLQSLFEDRAP